MSRWDIAEWVGPTPNRTVGGMHESRGLVVPPAPPGVERAGAAVAAVHPEVVD